MAVKSLILRNEQGCTIEYVAEKLTVEFNRYLVNRGINNRVYVFELNDDKLEFLISKNEPAFTLIQGIGEYELITNIKDDFAEIEIKIYLDKLGITNRI